MTEPKGPHILILRYSTGLTPTSLTGSEYEVKLVNGLAVFTIGTIAGQGKLSLLPQAEQLAAKLHATTALPVFRATFRTVTKETIEYDQGEEQ